MQDILNLILDELRGAWRFRWPALIATWVIALIGWFFVLSLPNRYEASARVFVDPSTALKPVIQGLAIEQDINAELNLVRQSILSEPQLEKVVAQTGMGNQAATPVEKSYVIDGLRGRIDIGVTGSAPNGGESGPNPSKVYTIKYQDGTRDRALKVVEILLANFMEGTLSGKRQGSAQAQKFLEDQIKDYEQRLGEAEERLATFKKQNQGMVPGEQQGDYFSRMQTEVDGVKKAQVALTAAMTRRDTLQRQLRGEGSIAASAGIGSGVTSPGIGGSGGDTLSRIKETQAKLDELLERYTDKHPDVVALKQTLVQLKARRASELEGLRRGDPNAAAVTGASTNPVYQSIQLALNQSDIEIASLRAELSDRQSKVADLKRLVDTMPQVEAEFARLNRDYAVTKTQYTALADRLEKARVGEEAEATGSVRFEVIDPPAANYKPVFPNRPLFMLLAFGAAVAVGIVLSYGLNLLKPVFNGTRSLASVTGLTVLGAVSLTRSAQEDAELRRGYLRYSAAAASLIVVFMIVFVVGRKFAPLGAHLPGL